MDKKIEEQKKILSMSGYYFFLRTLEAAINKLEDRYAKIKKAISMIDKKNYFNLFKIMNQ